MSTTTQTLCYNCFQQVADPAVPCPHCGFDLEENRQKFPVALPAGTVLNNRYIVGRVLGQGGFGITYVAFDTQLQARVAIKEYMPSDIATRVEGATVSVMMDTKSEDFTYGAERFQEEARTLAKFIGHPNIAGVSSYFDENGTSYFVMDYIEGVSFKSYIANNGGKVSVDETLNVMIPVLRALTAVHAEGFIHRDVTPDNIYISKDGNVKLLDFGSARYSIGDKSKSLDVILKVGYAPKEQYTRRGRQGPYTDVYSCAACFYAALTGYLPPESLDRLEHDTLTPVSQVMDIPEWLDKAILKGLAVQPEDRFQSAAEFLDAIENQLVVDVPVSGQTAPAQPAKKKLNPLVIGGAAAAIVVAVGLGAVLGGRGGGGASPDSGGDGGGILGALTGQDDGLPPLKKAEVPSITIKGEEYSTDLRELDLSGKQLTNEDIEPLHYMVNLTSLKLSYNQITDLTPLSNLTDLEILWLGGGEYAGTDNAELSDLSPLASLKKLKRLYLSRQSPICDLTPLANLAELQTLAMRGQRYRFHGEEGGVCDISPLAGLTKLESLDLDLDIVADTSPLFELVNLKTLYFYADDIGPDLSFLKNMKELTSLELNINNLTSLEGLEGLTNLQKLSIIGDNSFSDLSPMSGLNNLVELQMYLSTGNLSAMSSLKNVQKLELYLYADTDISPLKEMESLNILSIYENAGKVKDWSPVDHIPNVIGRD